MACCFCIGHVLGMRIIYLSIYIYFLTHVDVVLWFYYVSLFMMLWNANAYVMYYYTMCVFFNMIMHDVVVVCLLYAIVNVQI